MRLKLDERTYVYGDSVATIETEVISLWESDKPELPKYTKKNK